MEAMLSFNTEAEKTFKVKENIGAEQRAETEMIFNNSALLRDAVQQQHTRLCVDEHH
jgi:hypothetical protein